MSKDSDFLHLSSRYGHPPGIVRLVAGSCLTDEMVSLIRGHHEDLLSFYEDDDEAYLELP